MPGVNSVAALELLRDAMRRNKSATCPTCGHQGASLRVTEALMWLDDAIRRELAEEAADDGEAVSPLSGTAA